MKIFELEKKDRMPHLYLDMDGVQADLFHAVATRENVPSWNDIPDQDKAIHKISLEGPTSVYNLFANLAPLKGGQKIVKWLKANNIPFTILSAPLRNEPEASIKGKKDWLDKYNPSTSDTAKFTKQKEQYAITNGIPNVLVDDFSYYLDRWHNAGGIAVKHRDDTVDQTIKQLETIYSKYLDK